VDTGNHNESITSSGGDNEASGNVDNESAGGTNDVNIDDPTLSPCRRIEVQS